MAKVILVEDDDVARRAVMRMLEKLGHSVIGFCDGSLAREFLRTSTEDIQLIISDVRMPVMDGIEFYRWVVENRPSLQHRFLFQTSSEELLDAQEDLRAVPRLLKPASAKEFTSAIYGYFSPGNVSMNLQ